MEQNILDEVRDIKKSLRLAMNGVVSTLQRRQGLDYKINFGVEIPRLKGIAEAHKKNKELAATLWQDNIRECKMLAIYLMPESEYSEFADKWICEIKFTEIADQLAMHLLCKIPEAWEKALQWTTKRDDLTAYCGYLTISHLLRRGIEPSSKQEEHFFNSVISLNEKEEQSITVQCALNAIINYLDSKPDAVERLKAVIPGNVPSSTRLTTLLEDFA
jgi:hypothetical protein